MTDPRATDVPGASGSARAGGLLRRAVLVRLRFVAVLSAIVLAAAYWDDLAEGIGDAVRGGGTGDSTAGSTSGSATAAATHEYFCPMHPAVVRGEASACPSCGTALNRAARCGVCCA